MSAKNHSPSLQEVLQVVRDIERFEAEARAFDALGEGMAHCIARVREERARALEERIEEIAERQAAARREMAERQAAARRRGQSAGVHWGGRRHSGATYRYGYFLEQEGRVAEAMRKAMEEA
jgi:hypothetical protein